MRRYFIMNKNDAEESDYLEALSMCIGDPDTQRYSLNKALLLVKTTETEINNMILAYPDYTLNEILDATYSIEYTHEEILIEMQKTEWKVLDGLND